jgi:glycyl-radical enzyme activating protein
MKPSEIEPDTLRNTRGLVFDVQKFSLHDGPGIRTTVFLKGCPLRCIWCHNPESQRAVPELLFSPDKCIGCGWCFQQCPNGCHRASPTSPHEFHRDACVHCGICAEQCYAGAIEMAGKSMAAAEVIEDVLKDKCFYDNSNGGMTLSGGEPLAQPAFSLALARLARAEGVSVCLETCGHAPWNTLEALLPDLDWLLYDIKATDPAKHREFTGVDNQLLLENLRRASAAGAKIALRCPLVPDVNDDPAHLDAIAGLANELDGVQRIDIEPYHPLGVGKCARLDRIPDLDRKDFTPAELVSSWTQTVQSRTEKPVRVS